MDTEITAIERARKKLVDFSLVRPGRPSRSRRLTQLKPSHKIFIFEMTAAGGEKEGSFPIDEHLLLAFGAAAVAWLRAQILSSLRQGPARPPPLYTWFPRAFL